MFVKRWERLDVEKVPFFGGLHYMFTWLKSQMIVSGILSQRRYQNLVDLLAHEELLKFIGKDLVQGVNSFRYNKSHGKKAFDYIFRKLRKRGVDTRKKGSILFLGDSMTDVRCSRGKRAIRFVGVTTGPLRKEDFINEGVPPGNIIHAAYALPNWITKEYPDDQ